jgi:heterotetrameric sarcosine oxidase delta subunit
MRIKCPYCGSRDAGEFSYLGDATLKRPADGEHDIDGAMFDYVYLRDNPADQHREHWYHSAGCRSWLVVERDTRNHVIISVQLAFSEIAR